MRLTFIGAGYVGLVSAACLADVGNDVICVDKNAARVESLRNGDLPIYEPGLGEIIDRVVKEKRLHYTTDIRTGIEDAEICFITVDTPSDGNGNANISNVIDVAESIGSVLDHELIVITKSTVPVGTTLKIKEIIESKLRAKGLDTSLIKVSSNPEFLKEGDAVSDFKKPARIIVGVENQTDGLPGCLHNLYKPFMRKSDRFICMDIASAELTKYAANAMLATRISFMNSLARVCEKIGADIELVRKGVGADPRIGNEFLFAGIGYGGSCFPKDVKALIHLGREYGENLQVVEAVHGVNESQTKWFYDKIVKYFKDKDGLKNRKIGVWGVAFKANTDDVRDSQAIELIGYLTSEGAQVAVYDPVALENSKDRLPDTVRFCDDMYDCISDASLLIVCTDWAEFRSPNWQTVKEKMAEFVVFDGRNLYSETDKTMYYEGVGRNRSESVKA